MRVSMEAGVNLMTGRRKFLFEENYPGPAAGRPLYDVTADEQRFLMLTPADCDAEAVSPQVIVVQNFTALKRLVTTDE